MAHIMEIKNLLSGEAKSWNFSPCGKPLKNGVFLPEPCSSCAPQGRIPGAQKFGKSWVIPAHADRPEDLRRILDVTCRFS